MLRKVIKSLEIKAFFYIKIGKIEYKENKGWPIDIIFPEIKKEEPIKILEKYCKDNNLFMSGGSDCHGIKKADRKIGVGYGNLNVDKEILEEFINKN